MATQKEIKQFLKSNNLTEEQVDLMWKELLPLNQTAAMLDRSFGTWKKCPIHIISDIPTQKEKDLERIKKEKEEKERKQREEEQKLQEQKYYDENFEQIMLDKIDNKQKLSEEEIKRIIFDYSIDSEDIDESRWSMYTHSIVKLNNRTFRVEWERGLTECQENYFNSQLPVEVKQVERVVKVKVWESINE